MSDMRIQDRETASPEEGHEASASGKYIKVVLADSQSLYRDGLLAIFAVEDDLRVVAHAETVREAVEATVKFAAQVVLFESAMAHASSEAVAELVQCAPGVKVIALSNNPSPRDVVKMLRTGASAIVSRAISPELLTQCVRKVAAGEIWLDHRRPEWALHVREGQSPEAIAFYKNLKLSDKEILIIAGVSRGMRNKEVATQVGTSEQVIKNCLRKIYGKLGVSDRLELALYCVHHPPPG